MENLLREKNLSSNHLLCQIAFIMATGSGKTMVMTILIAWKALNKIADSQALILGCLPDRHTRHYDQ